ncbi:hypothetical protein NM688_g9343 [Phlebia brevispora]|uniref:Uncharacterized protein n=1 Tax=Phlebia brevispora TaxID=194682 RepID=A0ACC1RL08_9APHY|nr:hypothetical protein NM688_g9343 [Phlebia brevispora]
MSRAVAFLSPFAPGNTYYCLSGWLSRTGTESDFHTVALSIADWTSGTFTAPKEYNTSLAEQYFGDVIAEFGIMKKRSMMGYHRIMHNLWNRVNSMTGGGASSSVQGTRGPSKMALEE